ncbi:MAG: hypothetical protein AAGA62_16570, partial [Bacteroidota bacterium]
RKARKALTELAQRWGSYEEKYRGQASSAKAVDLVTLRNKVGEAQKEIQADRQQLNRALQANALSLSRVTANPHYVDPDWLKTLEERLNDLVRQIDEAGLYQLPVGGAQAATTPRQLQLLETILDRLRNTQLHLGELEDFYARRHFWYAQPARLRRLMAPLLSLNPEEGETAFSAWYFERCLERVTSTPPVFEFGELPPETSDALALGTTDLARLRIILREEPLPSLGDEALYCVFSGELPDLDAEGVRTVFLAPPQDLEAHHLSLAGALQPGLLLTQYFATARPPAWSAVAVASPPPASEGRLSFQRKEDDVWRSIIDWERGGAEHFNLYFPLELTAKERTWLLSEWPYLMTASPRISLFHAWSPNQITQGLLSDGFSAEFLVAALLRAAEAADTAPFDRAALLAIGREIRAR